MRKFILFFATGGGVGYFPKMPGTFGSAVGLLLYLGLKHLSPGSYLVTLVTFILFSCWISTLAESALGEKDPQKVVIDEVAGILVTLMLLPWSWTTAIAGFVLFRIFDIWKPFPVRWCQDRLPHGWGVVLDDVAAGIYANIVLRLILRFV